MFKILLVCMGNICRSPMAEGVLRAHLQRAGLGARVSVASAGTAGAHAGEAPDNRALQVAAKRGYDLSGIRSKRIRLDDFTLYDCILAMDGDNLETLRRRCPAELQDKICLFLEFSQVGSGDVPDPYYGNLAGFERVLELCERGAEGVVKEMRARAL
ncbi:MAG: low molecular weight phosphotyrosine protein phosphatase [Azonexus sp.]|nr:low molecular weight phosphotyrosine protein phosphatase [Betaproteobacteria bacterium]MBK8916899.1 low molecular weight phosphotyrosine protein phosphatase [Betaproteobacteria bacterium]MBP6036144.1 low molecular weight phosphotyrosine protein phosphatase [Azonexus sp.]MBP6906667.1 low molecular weight phosphotyrosine protein phosphatase [Azonexus sp.]